MAGAGRTRRRLTRGERNIAWIERHLRIPEGRDVGKPVRLRPWQKKIIRSIYDTPTRRAIISFGRKNGKTALVAFLLLLHLVGPEARPKSQLYSAAQSREQAALLFELAAKMVRMSPDLSEYVIVRDATKQLACAELGTLYVALSAEASTAYGRSPVFCVHDELGQVRGPRSELYEALETGAAAHDDPLSIIISTQAPNDTDLLSVLIDDAITGADPQTKVFLYTAPIDVDAFGDKAIRLANPAFGDFQNAAEVRRSAQDAKRMPAREAEYRNLVLNQRVEMRAPFVSESVWAANGKPPCALWGLPVYGGLDLSAVSDLTALVLIGIDGRDIPVEPTFWLPEKGLREKARRDRVPYDVWAKQGHLQTTPGAAIEYEWVAHRLRKLVDELNVRKIGFDRFAMKFLRPWLLKAGFTEDEVDEIFVEFGQGTTSMGPALREFEQLLLQGRLRHGNHPVLNMCRKHATVKKDPSGFRKFEKDKATGRIDGMVSLAMAIGVAGTALHEDDISDFLRDPVIAGRHETKPKRA